MNSLRGNISLSLILLLAISTIIGLTYSPGEVGLTLLSFSLSKTHASSFIGQSIPDAGLQMGILTITPTPTPTPFTSSQPTSCIINSHTPCACIPPAAAVISCQYYVDCPVGGYIRTFIPGAAGQLGCLFDTGASTDVYINDTSCSNLSCP